MPRKLPLWALGLANAPLGFYYGFINTSMPLLLVAQGIPLDRVATISAIAFSPTFWIFILAPALDVRLSRRTHAVLWTAIAAACLFASVLLLHHTVLFTVALTLGCAATGLFSGSLGGWLPQLVPDDRRGHLSTWYNIANLGVAAVYGVSAIYLVQRLPGLLSASILALLIVAPTLLLFALPAPEPPTRKASAVFRALFHDLGVIFRQREVLLALLAFITPASCFALTNLFAGLGPDFHTPERWVTLLCGAGVAVACSLGCLVGGPLADRFSRIHIYIVTGLAGAAVAGASIVSPRSTMTFAAATLAYNFLQGINYTAYSALCFQLVGTDNPLAATQFSVLFCAINLPISYMTWIDGRGYAAFGIRGLFGSDALFSVLAGVILLACVSHTIYRSRGRTAQSASSSAASDEHLP